MIEALRYDEEQLNKFLGELDSPLPGQAISETAAARAAEEEMALFRKAQGGA
jgi:hypothetical protein